MSWYFSKQQIENSPSRRAGISEAEESKLRKEGAKFIMTCSSKLGLRYDTKATAVVFFHRFYMMESISEYRKFVLACSCLLLAGKVEETPKKARDVLKTAKEVLKSEEWADFGEEPKEKLFLFERILLKRINFDLNVSHPYSHLLVFAKGLKGDKPKLQKLVQVAWNFINDSLVTTLCLQWEPEPAAIAFLYLAAKLSKLDLQGPAKKSWWLKFVNDVDQHDLEDICGIVLDSYDEDEMEKEGLQIMTAAANVTSSSLDRRKSLDEMNHFQQGDLAAMIPNSLDPSLLAMQHAPLPSTFTKEQLLQQLLTNSTQIQANQLATYSSLLTQSIPPLDPKTVAQAQSTLNNLLTKSNQMPINLTPTAHSYNNFLGHGQLTPTPPPPPPPPPPPNDPFLPKTSGKHSHRDRHNSSVPPPPKRPPPLPVLTPTTAAPPLPYQLDPPPPRPRHPPQPQPPPPPPPPSYQHHYHPPHSHTHGRAAN